MRLRLFVTTLSAAAGLAACGLSAVGALPSGDGPDGGAWSGSSSSSGSEGSTSGGMADGGSDPADDGGPPGCDAGFGDASVTILAAEGAACPAGTVEQMLRTDPQAQAGACACGACIALTAPSCAGNDLTLSWGSSSSCGASSRTYDIGADDTCYDLGFGEITLSSYNRWENRVPTNGTCMAATVLDATKVTSTSFRTCAPSTNDALCAAIAAGQRLCMTAEPDGGACAAGFPVRVVVGDATSLTCGDCGCSNEATACRVEYHRNSECTEERYARTTNGNCTSTNSPTEIQFFKIFPTGQSCTTTPGTPTPSLVNERALCCTP